MPRICKIRTIISATFGIRLLVIRIGTCASLLSFMFSQILGRNAVHAEYFNFNIRPIWKWVRYFVDSLLVHLHTMYRQAWPCIQFLMAYVAFKMLCFLMLYENFFIVKLTVAIPENIFDSWLLLVKEKKNSSFIVLVAFVRCSSSHRCAMHERPCLLRPAADRFMVAYACHRSNVFSGCWTQFGGKSKFSR